MTKCCERDRDADGNCDRHPAGRQAGAPAVRPARNPGDCPDWHALPDVDCPKCNSKPWPNCWWCGKFVPHEMVCNDEQTIAMCAPCAAFIASKWKKAAAVRPATTTFLYAGKQITVEQFLRNLADLGKYMPDGGEMLRRYCNVAADTLAAAVRPEPQQADILESLKWAERQLRALVTEDDGNGAFIKGTGTELSGFGAGLSRLRAAVARAEQEKPRP